MLQIMPGSPKTWSPCMCDTKIRVTSVGDMPTLIIRCCVASPQSKSHASPSPASRSVSACWPRVADGRARTPCRGR